MLKKISIGLATLTALAVAIYIRFLRPWYVRWGATDEEVNQSIPGDAEVAQANFQSTRAITMHAQATDIWPWLVQMGQGRGGLYTYTWLENMVGLRISNVDQILAEFQHLKVGDIIPLEAGGSGYRVGAIEPNQLLELVIQPTDSGFMGTVMKQGNGASTWVYLLHELDSEHTRLIVRWRMRWNPSFKAPILVLIRLLLAPVEFVMERKMILGIKKRAERMSKQISEPAGATSLN
ncbi:MAG: hypothetical protein H0U76_14455 [Ktedonobacteraceae bacterium]|nr:hypothetical protein [Ktedonobacteraceae bacterium]